MDSRYISNVDTRFNQLEQMGFTKNVDSEDEFVYYTYESNGLSLYSSGTDEKFKVYFDNTFNYWTDLDTIKGMIYFINQSEVD